VSDIAINNCRLDLENYEELAAMPDLPAAFMSFSIPQSVDVKWHKTEQQARLGSCNGVAGASALERLRNVFTGEITQLSDIYCYLGSQQIGGLLGVDQGSRPTDFLKLAMEGVPPESLTGYPSSYPSAAQIKAILSPANRAAGAPYKAKSVCVFRKDASAESFRQFIGGGGAIVFGIKWYSLIPSGRRVLQYAPPGGRLGGHANAILGYEQNGDLIGVNSWGDGPYRITPKALEQMIRYPGNVFVGLMGNEGAPVDFSKESVFKL
jgi:hypothetical protein